MLRVSTQLKLAWLHVGGGGSLDRDCGSALAAGKLTHQSHLERAANAPEYRDKPDAVRTIKVGFQTPAGANAYIH